MLLSRQIVFLLLLVSTGNLFAQNIAINTTGTAAAAANLFEVTQPAGAANNSVGIFASHLGTATNTYAIWAQATGATNKYAIVVPAGGGKVGIGTTVPQVSLHVLSDIPNTTTALHPYRAGAIIEGDQNTFGGRLSIMQANSNSSMTLFRTNGTLAAPTALLSGELMGALSFGGYDGTIVNSCLNINSYAAENWTGTAHGSDLAFNTINISAGASFAGTEKMRITSEGKVGIGLTAPLGSLHIASISSNFADRMSNTANEGANFIFRKARGTVAAPLVVQNGDELGKFIVAGYDGSGYIMTGGISGIVNGVVAAGSIPTDLVFGVNSVNMGNPTSNEAMRITNTRNVGIGSNAPAVRLEVSGSEANNQVGAGTSAVIRLVNTNAATGGRLSELQFGHTATTKFAAISGAISDGGNNSRGDLLFSTRNAPTDANLTERMRIDGAGNVGIAVSNPAYLLEVNGTFGFGDGTAGSYRSRTETRNDAGLIATQSGFFQTAAPSPSTSWPTSTASASSNFDASGNATSWWHLIDTRHSNNGNNYALQISGGFFDQSLYYRKTNNSASTPWSKLVTTATSVMAPSVSFPDGLANPVAIVKGTGAAWSYVVTAGKNLYITSYYSGIAAGNVLSVGGTTVIDGLCAFNSASNPTIMKLPVVAPGGATVAGPAASAITGFEVPAVVTPITQTNLSTTPYTVTAGKTLVILQVYMTGGSTLSASIDGGTTYFNVKVGYSNVSGAGNPNDPPAVPIILPAGTKVKMSLNGNSFNGYEF